MKKLLAGTTMMMLLSTTVFAAKAHRESKKEMAPKLTEATAAIKTACGYSPSLSIDKAFDKVKTDEVKEYARNMAREFENVAKMSKKFCSDAESKALYKKHTKKIIFSVVEGGDAQTTYKKGSFTIKTTKQGNSGGYKYQQIMDEW